MKTLLFEGAGCPNTGTDSVNNCRIRTAFEHKSGQKIYLELLMSAGVNTGKTFCEFAFNIDTNIKYSVEKTLVNIKYDAAAIVNWVNTVFKVDFDNMAVAEEFDDYRVHADDGGYNMMQDFPLDPALAKRRKAAFDKADKEYREHCKSKYTVLNIDTMSDTEITLKCYASDEKLGDWARVFSVSTGSLKQRNRRDNSEFISGKLLA